MTSRGERFFLVSLDDLIQGALSLFRPIIDTSQPLQDDTTINKQVASRQMPNRDREILGAPRYSSLDDVPICKGNSRICNFISCTAHNFKNDQSFANINLAAQVLADTKLRKAISKDPDALTTVCHEQGLSGPQCRLFQKGFQLIDKFITSIEPVDNVPQKMNTITKEEDDFYTEEPDAAPVPIRPVSGIGSGLAADDPPFYGSHTWSSHSEQVDAINSHPSLPDSVTLATFPPLLFILPTMPTMPFVNPIRPVTSKDPISPLTSFSFDNQLLKQPFFGSNTKQIYDRLTRISRSARDAEELDDFDDPDADWARQKRNSDYYDGLEEESATEKPRSTERMDHVYYDAPVHEEQIKPPIKPKKADNGHVNCLQHLQ
ncbi:unnamed protein product [Toxocara canis]|uniref:HRDC domain-containing protein n=1 Tax=Toxocara canis TaxID=6265 RepID=A0A183UH08_TOXCA|nr:unnamed protein product [Toxocara canis]